MPGVSVITFTGNLLSERTFDFAAWEPGRTQRASAASFQVGGKGINVAKMLLRLRSPVTATGFVGGATGAECTAWLREREIPWVGFATASDTRAGLVVRGGAGPETTFLGPDRPPDAAAIRAAAAFLEAQPDGQALAICGSLPGWEAAAFDPLREAFERWLTRGSLFADTYGTPLAWFAARRAALIKVNRSEFDGLFPATGRTESVAERLRRTAGAAAPAAWIVTDGPGPVWLGERASEPQSYLTPPVREVSPTGSGDVLLAALLHARLQRHLSWAGALVFALPYAAANAAHPGVAEFPLRPDLSVEL